ncbi:MAG TPA: glycosyltransferase [Patescibacteria group bacterium]|nr:glycosyltransferase [Patescibacteria group bacterium]
MSEPLVRVAAAPLAAAGWSRADGLPAGRAAGPGSRPGSRPGTDGRRRVLHVISTLLPGGTELSMLRLIRSMDPNAWTFRVAWLMGEPALGREIEQATGAAPLAIGLRGKADPRALLRLRRVVRDERIDLVHTHMDLADYYGAAAARLTRGTGLVCTKENADEFRTRRTWKRPPFLLLEHLSYAAADAVIAVSHGLADFLARAEGLPRHKTVVIENGVDITAAAEAPPRRAARALLGLPGEAPLLGTVGRLAAQKGQRDLVRALPSIRAAVPGARLVIAGDGPLRGELEEEARRAGVAGEVHFLGHRNDVPVILSALDLFVLPSLWEGLPLALLEAMSMSLPVVATRAVGIEETVSDGVEGLLVPCGDPDALARAAARVLGDHHLALGFGTAGRRRVVARHSLAAVADRIDALYRRVLGGEP